VGREKFRVPSVYPTPVEKDCSAQLRDIAQGCLKLSLDRPEQVPRVPGG
jgi:hypothetical protein